MMISATVNGELREFKNGETLLNLLESLNLTPKGVFIEYNRQPLDRLMYGGTLIKDGDNIEVVAMMAGG